jgi:predicted AlkP superfamily pyrophosphatase or phosphodiesterase
MAKKKIFILDVAGLSWDLVSRFPAPGGAFAFQKADSIFPAVTCPVQATFRTAALPRKHGMVASGIFESRVRKVSFWEQSAALVEGERIWDGFRREGGTVGMMFWQQSLGENVDLVLSPKPIHKHHGGMIQDCYSQPQHLYTQICSSIGKSFNLMHYWGPLASGKSSDWIVASLRLVMSMSRDAPDVLMGYLPHLDYVLQREGPHGRHVQEEIMRVYGYLDDLKRTCRAQGYEYLIFGDYAIENASHGAVYPNRLLREAGFFQVHHVKGMMYPDLYASSAFAMVDHQVGHVYVLEAGAINEIRRVLHDLPGVDMVLDHDAQKQAGINHYHSGQFVLVAKPGYWFAYPWWSRRSEEPEFAAHVDIHNKPGFDPCELRWGIPFTGVSRNTRRIGGTHGRIADGMEVAWTSSITFSSTPRTLTGVAQNIKHWLDHKEP